MLDKNAISFNQIFDHFVDQGNIDAEENRDHYIRNVKSMMAKGNMVIYGLLFAFIALLAGTVTLALLKPDWVLVLIKTTLVLIPIFALWVIGVSVFQPIKKPDGYTLTRKDFPQIWAQLDMLQSLLKIPKIHYVIVSDRMRLDFITTPRIGLFIPYVNTLEIGLPVLASTNTEDMESLLAAELAQYSHLLDKPMPRISRKRRQWMHIYGRIMNSRIWGIKWFRNYVKRYVPMFAGYSMALTRLAGVDADALASDKMSADTLSSALLKTHMLGEWLKRYFWPAQYRLASSQSVPPSDAIGRLYQRLSGENEISVHELNNCRRPALFKKVDRYETSAELATRLKLIGGRIDLSMTGENAAVVWIGSPLDDVIKQLNKTWVDENKSNWKHTYIQHAQALADIKQLKAKSSGALTQAELWKLVNLVREFQPQQNPVPFFKIYQAQYPDDKRVDFEWGNWLIEQNNPEGIEHLKQAFEEATLADRSAYLISEYYHNNNDRKSALEWQGKIRRSNDVLEQARLERQEISETDHLVAPEAIYVAEQELELLGSIHTHPNVEQVWIAQKQVQYMPDDPVFVMAIITQGARLKSAIEIEEQLAKKTETQKNLFIVSDLSSRKLVQKVKSVGLNIYG